MGAGYVDAVTKAVVKNVAVATRDLGESLETPHRKWPLVHPDPSYLSAYSLMVIIYSPDSRVRQGDPQLLL